MRSLLIAASALSLLAAPALAQPAQGHNVVTGPPGLRSSEPLVHHPTHLGDQPDRGQISPALPSAQLGPNASVTEDLMTAHRAIQHHRLGLAQEALERANTAALNDYELNLGAQQSTTARNIHAALEALGRHDPQMAMNIIEQTVPATQQVGEGYGNGGTHYGAYDHEAHPGQGPEVTR